MVSEILAPLDAILKVFDDATAAKLEVALGMPIDQCRMVLIFFLNYPLSWLFAYFVHGTTARHLYNVVVGLTVQYYAFGTGIWHSFLMTIVAYLIMNLLPRRT